MQNTKPVTDAEMAEIMENFRRSSFRCPACKSPKLSSGMTGHKCLDCKAECLYGQEFMSIEEEEKLVAAEGGFLTMLAWPPTAMLAESLAAELR